MCSSDLYLAEAPLKFIKIANTNNNTIETGFMNYCGLQYYTKSGEHYRKSCLETDKIIRKYNLKNIIKVKKKNFSFKGGGRKSLIPLLGVYESSSYFKNNDTGEVLMEEYSYAFVGGWYWYLWNYAGMKGMTYSCDGGVEPPEYIGSYEKLEKIIPNPYYKYKSNNPYSLDD